MKISAYFLVVILYACNSNSSAGQHPDKMKEAEESPAPEKADDIKTTAPVPSTTEKKQGARPLSMAEKQQLEANGLVDVIELDPEIALDIRYATTNNFTKAQIYDCPRCLLRKEAAEALVKANKALKKKGLHLVMFDCYRPRPYQQRLWDKVPNPDYVTPPAKGSMHSRGAAVDLSIADAHGQELDMGTPYDFFGRKAHTDITDLPQKVLDNRKLLQQALKEAGFEGIRTEWWHFSFRAKTWPLSDYVWPCD